MNATRFIALQGGYNFRDLGGYTTEDGRHVKLATVFRAAALSSLTPDDVALIDRLGIRLVIDLRTNHERERRPSQGAMPTWTRNYKSSNADLHRMLRNPATTLDECRAAMRETYRSLPEEQVEAYRELFHRIAAGDVPILFHCAVGKDRTGVAAALLLAFLGVPRSTIEEDYLQTLNVSDRLAADARAAIELMGSTIGDDAIAPILEANLDYLDAMFSEIDKRYGSVEGYAKERLRLTTSELDTIRDRLLAE